MRNPTIPTSELQQHRWGWSRYLHVGETVAVAVAWGRGGGASSLHWHRNKANTFLVDDGNILIVGAEGDAKPMADLKPGDAFTVASECQHRMVFVSDAVVYEVYVADPRHVIDMDDIVRKDLGWGPEDKPGKPTE